jgi:WS/DGAT/MGAT family acyltransferase
VAAPSPGPLERLARGVWDRTREQVELVRKPLGLLASPDRLSAAVDDARRAVESVVSSFGQPAQPTPALNPSLSPLRHLARIPRPMADVVRIKSHFGTTINDVVLAACSAGTRSYLQAHGEHSPALKVMMPVALRSAEDAGGLGNRISFLFIDLHADEPDPVRALRAIHHTTTECKRTGDAEAADMVLNALGYAPHVVQRMLTRIFASPRSFNLVVSNIPGPQVPMWMDGCRLREVYPIVPLAERHALAIGVTSLEDGIFFGLYADRKMMPDATRLARCIDDAIDELLTACDEPAQPPPNGNGHRALRAVEPLPV